MKPPPAIPDPHFERLLEAVENWLSRCGNDRSVLNMAVEVIERVKNLQSEYQRLMELNQKVLTTDSLATELKFDAETGTMFFGEVSLTFNRADPDIPVTLDASSEFMPFTPGRPRPMDTAENSALRSQLGIGLDHFYYTGHLVYSITRSIVQRRTGKKNPQLPFPGVSAVRNHLLEHVDRKGEYRPYGYAADSSSPRLRPYSKPDDTWSDRGLAYNADEFVRLLTPLFDDLDRGAAQS